MPIQTSNVFSLQFISWSICVNVTVIKQWLTCQNVCLSVFGRVLVGGWYDLHICTWQLISIAPIILHHIINSDLSHADRSMREGHLHYLLWLFWLSSTALLSSIPDVCLLLCLFLNPSFVLSNLCQMIKYWLVRYSYSPKEWHVYVNEIHYRQCVFKLLDNAFWDFAEYICFTWSYIKCKLI